MRASIQMPDLSQIRGTTRDETRGSQVWPLYVYILSSVCRTGKTLLLEKLPPSDNGERRYIFADIEASQKDELVQCEWGYAPRLDTHCAQCRH